MRGRSPQTQITPMDQLPLGHHVENSCGVGTWIVRVELPRDFFVRGPSPEAPSSSCFTPQCHSYVVSETLLRETQDWMRDEEAPKSECVCEESERGTSLLTGVACCEGIWVLRGSVNHTRRC